MKFTLIASGAMSLLLALTTLPFMFAIVGEGWLGVSPSLSSSIRSTLSIVILWPFAIEINRSSPSGIINLCADAIISIGTKCPPRFFSE
jgi:Mg2+/citrate symporter